MAAGVWSGGRSVSTGDSAVKTHKDIRQTVCLDGQSHELLSQIAHLQQVSMSEAARRAIRNLANDCDLLTNQQRWQAQSTTQAI
jgi:hypothetical protein